MLKQLDTLIGFAVVMSVVSLLITIATQIVSAVLGLRGRNLAKALEALVLRIDPELGTEPACNLVNRILTDDLISDSIFSVKSKLTAWLERASAIRPEEMLDILRKLANEASPTGSPPETSPLSSPPDPESSNSIPAAARRVLAVLDAPTGETALLLNAVKDAFPKLVETQGIAAIAHLKAAGNVALNNVEGWFNAAQDRAKQWFAMHTRIITVLCAILAAYGLQLDSFKLIKRISSDPEFRSRLVASAPALAKQAQDVFDAASPFSQSNHLNAIAGLNKEWPGISSLVLSTNVTSVARRDDEVRPQLAKLFTNKVDQAFEAYTNAMAAAATGKVDDWTQRFGTINDQLSSTGIELLPAPYPKTFGELIGTRRHFFGLLASAALLSLGAPFWFNSLKTLTNLRPALAQQVDKSPRAGVNPSN